MSRFVVKPADPDVSHRAVAGAEPLEDTGLFVVDAEDKLEVFDMARMIAWAAPTIDDAGHESYPTGEVSVRFQAPLDQADLDQFVHQHGVELRRRNEFVPEQVTVAPLAPRKTWLPDVVERLNEDDCVAEAWPNTRSRYHRG